MDPEILSNRHLEHLALRAKKSIKILKYISSRDWGDDAGTLRNVLRFPHLSHFGILASPSSVAPLIQTCKNLNVFNSVLEVLQQALQSLLSESYIEISKVMEQSPEAQMRQSLWAGCFWPPCC
ncbi:hypothetical protein TNCV_4941641 [Trichonephila clavipes]|nr:hypothetical protein TNCV_4941641 [Trichonephila clavipes]